MSRIICYKNRYWKIIHDFQYTGTPQEFTLDTGEYLLMCHGAQGGPSSTNTNINYGGVAYGVLNVTEPKTLYAYVGGNGQQGANGVAGIGGYNGGADGSLTKSSYVGGSGGGGASDIRISTDETPVSKLKTTYSIPEEYQEVEYIHSSGDQYIDTGIKDYLKIELDVKFDDNVTNRQLMGFTHSSTGQSFGVNTSYVYEINSGTIKNTDGRVRGLLTYEHKSGGSVLTFGESSVTGGSGPKPSQTFRLFGLSTSTSYKCHATIYSAKIYLNAVLSRYFVPCYKKEDNTPGLFDILNNTFYPNQGTGSFDIGPDVSEENKTKYEEYIEINPSLYTRIIVAGGGGGSTLNTEGYVTAGDGGGSLGSHVRNYITGDDVNTGEYASQTNGYSFGIGMPGSNRTASNLNGNGGGGGGWYGGFSNKSSSTKTKNITNGGGGSSYVLTSSSYKPQFYEVDESYYLTNIFMSMGEAIDPCIYICEEVHKLRPGDIVEFPCVGWTEYFKLPLGTFKLKCSGGDGNCRYNPANAKRGGYAEGILSLHNSTNMFANVGGTGFFLKIPEVNLLSQYKPTVSFNGGGQIVDNIGKTGEYTLLNGGGGSDIGIFINDESDKLYSRIIVAGGAGAEGASGSLGGEGGGIVGGTCTGKYGTSEGPGTQTSSPGTPETNGGGFGYGGNGFYQNGGYGGAAGGGWYGGAGCIPDTRTDDDMGGSGGSGFVLTVNTTTLPEGYLVDKNVYGLTDTILTSGGNTLPIGHSKIEIEVIDSSYILILMKDSDGIKRYDQDNNTWKTEDDLTELNEDSFKKYGVYVITTDNGLKESYQVFALTDNVLENDVVSINVVPNTQVIETEINSTMFVTETYVDCDIDTNTHISTDISRSGVAEGSKIKLKINIDMMDIPTSENVIYAVNAYSTATASSFNRIEKPKVYSEHVDLLPVGTSTRINSRYKNYMSPETEEGVTITSINTAMSYEHKREIYTLLLLNDTTYRLVKLNLLSNKSVTLWEINKSSFDNLAMGGFVVDNDYVYMTHSKTNSYRSLWRVSIYDKTDIKKFTPSSSSDDNFNACGKIQWIDNHTIGISCKYGFMTFDTITTTFTMFKSNSSYISYDMAMSNALGILTQSTDNNRSSITKMDLSTKTFTDITMKNNKRCVVCYDNTTGKFYVSQQGYVYILNNIGEIEKTIVAPFGTLNPSTINYADGLLYITMQNSNILFVYNISTDEFRSIGLRMTNFNQVYDGLNILRPTTFRHYFFMPYYQLFVMNYVSSAKYNMGYKYNQYTFLTNESFKKEYKYDKRFVTFNDSHISIHTGNIEYVMEIYDETNCIMCTSINKTDYRKFINGKILTK